MTPYESFLERKTHLGSQSGFSPVFMPDFLFPFQRALTTWAVEKGRAAIFAGTGLGKTAMQLVWAQNVVEKTNKPVLTLTPLAVGAQTVREATKFGLDAKQSRDGKIVAPITVTNYQQLHKFDWKEFGGVVCDESSILKNFDGQIKAQITEFMRKLPYRLLCTATAAPNDYIELGTSSEALGDMGYMDMIGKFFKTADGSGAAHGGAGRIFHAPGKMANPEGGKFRFRGHAEHDFWRWVCSWARAVRKPSDLGFSDDAYDLPPLETFEHIIKASTPNPDFLFDMPAVGLKEQRQERRRTIEERCEKAASLIRDTNKPAIAWCHLNDEGDLLEKLIPGAVNVEGSDSDEFKEETAEAFVRGDIRVIVSKSQIFGFGMNWQHCAHQTFFPSHSFEQYFQAVRRSWRFGQTQSVRIDMISSEGEVGVLANLARKAEQAEKMFAKLVALINNELTIKKANRFTKPVALPAWL